jgi:UDP-N-acetylglucosamine 4,6-dehydratase
VRIKKTKFSVCRYGNVLGSRGSIIPLFKKQYKDTGKITITHKDMTRFWITPENAIKFILGAIDDMRGNEIFVPVMSSAKVLDIAQAIVPDAEYEEIGVRPGEKLHECLISESESQKCWENIARKYFIISDRFKKSCKDKTSFEYRSDSNTKWLNQKQIKEMIGG